MAASQPRLITTGKITHLLANQTESLADLVARRHPRLTACGRKIDGYTGHAVHGPYAIHVTCGNCRRTKASHRAADAYFLYEHGAEVADQSRRGASPALGGYHV
jgi:hypothetical protein